MQYEIWKRCTDLINCVKNTLYFKEPSDTPRKVSQQAFAYNKNTLIGLLVFSVIL